MHKVFVIGALGAWIALTGQAAVASVLEGVVTLADSKRSLLVIQEGDHARAITIDGILPPMQAGDRVKVEGQPNPYFGAFPDYPAHPAGWDILPAFEARSDWKDHFLARLRGFLRAPADGDYTFWITADEEGELLLGENSDPASARLIASSPRGLWPLAWDHDPEQKSKPIHLKAGERYYIEARQREWRGHDNLIVAWEGDRFEREVISGKYLSPWRAENGETNGIFHEYWTNCFITRLAALSPEAQPAPMVAVSGARIERLEPGQLPVARPVTPGALAEVKSFSWVEIEGTVGFAGADQGTVSLEVKPPNARSGTGGAGMQLRILNWDGRPVAHLANRRVRAQGVFERTIDSQGRSAGGIVWLQNQRQLALLDFAESDIRGLEALPMFAIKPANLNLAWGRKVLVRGIVTSHDGETGRVLMRGDDSFYAYSSTDGKTWTAVGTPVTATMDDSILIGLAAASITTTQATEVVFSQFGLDPARSQTVAIGGGAVAGGVTFSNQTASLRPAVGNDWVNADMGLFVCQSLDGQGEIVARLDSFKTTRVSDKVGLMMRGSLAADAPYVALVATHGTRLDLQYRQSRGDNAKAVQRVAGAVPCWLKLVRQRHTLAAQMMNGETLRIHQPVELVGVLNWTNGEPMLADAYVRPADGPAATIPTEGTGWEVQIADLPSTAVESDQYLNRDFLIRGVVTFKGRVFDREYLFLQDESGAALVRASAGLSRSEQIEGGHMIEGRGDILFAPDNPPFRLNTATILGWGTFPRPLPYPERSDAKFAENRWVEAKGVVRSVTNNVMRLMEGNGPLLVWANSLDSAGALARYVDCLVTVRGVFTRQAASEPALLVPSTRFIQVIEAAPADPFVIPSHAINKVCSPEQSLDLLHRTKVTGVATYCDERMLIVQDQTGGAQVFGSGTERVRVGDRVEAVGFPNQEGDVVTLRESVVRRIGEGHSPVPIEMMIEGMLDGRLNGWLVRLEGILLDQKTRQGRQLLDLQNGQRVFQAVLPQSAGQLSSLPAGSRVQVTGVSRLQVAHPSPAATMERADSLVATVDVLMRSPEDLVLLERPPWWTWRHTATVGVLLVVVLIAAVGWIRSLRRRVAQRTDELQVAMSRLQKETELSATLAERERLAAEIHDTLEQGLSGIMMQLDGADARLTDDAGGARENLDMARRMVRLSRAEVRHSLWNMESHLLKDGDLGAAIEEIARQMTVSTSTAVIVNVSDSRYALPPAIQHHLLRCTQEAIGNALKHSGAKRVQVTLGYSADKVELEITDNGSGFDPDKVLTGPGTHLGLRNLRSRTRKMKGRLDISSTPNHGTTVRFTVPVTARGEKTSTLAQ